MKKDNTKNGFDVEVLVIVVGFLLLSLVIPSVKIYFLVAYLLIGYLTVSRSFSQAFIYCFIPLLSLNIGQSHSVQVVALRLLSSDQYWTGRHIGFSLSPVIVLSLIALVRFIVLNKKKPVKKNHIMATVIAIYLLGVLTAFVNPIFPIFSLVFLFYSFINFIWASYLIIYSKQHQQTQWLKMIKTLFFIVVAVVAFESLIVLGQQLFKSPLGLFIEPIQSAPVFGLGADEWSGFRPFGLHHHPNGLANSFLIRMSMIMLLATYLRKKKFFRKIELGATAVSLLLCVVIILLTLSRAAYLGLLFLVIFLWIRHKQLCVSIWSSANTWFIKIALLSKICFLFLAALLLMGVAQRVISSLESFGEIGGFTTRFEQYAEAIEVFKSSIFLGIGEGMFIPASIKLFPDGVMRYFPENVHNGFLLFLVEKGVFATVLYILFLVSLVRQARTFKKDKLMMSVIYLSVLLGYVMMIFHPEKNYFSLAIILVFVITSYETNQSS